ncbi:MAG TPA: endolytic transglycosylase MltG [Candidatus Saccharimonadales bacterium]|nr:endolytic transglycosylase MltG [Candidatus Saccharimonadales bacterium]
MTKFNYRKGLGISDRKKVALVIGILLIIALFGSAILVRKAYQDNLRPLSASNAGIVVTIEPGSTPNQIAELLKDNNVIKSDWAFEWYVRNHNLRDKLKAGTYLFKPSQSVAEIVDSIASGEVATDLVTILPGRRIDQIRGDLIKDGFSPEKVDKALNPKQYASHPALTDKPEGASLEGYLYPESFQKTADTDPIQIVRQSLNEMQFHLTPELRSAINKQGLTIHQGVILASIIEREVSIESDRPIVSQVFLKRLRGDVPLQSNATDAYAEINKTYDTYKIKGLPPGPVSNVTKSALEAVAYPAGTDWLYFVSGDDGRTHFSKTLQEHEALVKKHCKKLCN